MENNNRPTTADLAEKALKSDYVNRQPIDKNRLYELIVFWTDGEVVWENRRRTLGLMVEAAQRHFDLLGFNAYEMDVEFEKALGFLPSDRMWMLLLVPVD